jgi:hypothetical protein
MGNPVLPPLLQPLPEPPLLQPEPWYSGGILGMLSSLVRGALSLAEWLTGLCCLVVGLAVLSAIPVAQLLVLGYLLEVGGRVARTGKLREGFLGVRLAARIGKAIAAACLLMIPVWLVSAAATQAAVIDPGGPSARAWRLGLLLLIAVTFTHIASAALRGGKLIYFLWPFNALWLARRILRGGYYREARDAVWDTVQRLRLPYYFWLGLRGLLAGLLWLFFPVTLLVLGHLPGVGPLFGWAGAMLLALVVFYLPFLQVRMAAEGRFWAAVEVWEVRDAFFHAPFLFTLSLILTLLLALPLYLLRVETVPAETAWLPGLVFIAFALPARLTSGWALAVARKRDDYAHPAWRLAMWLLMLPVPLLYVLVVYFTQFTSFNGIWSLYEQHAFLLPVPLLGG